MGKSKGKKVRRVWRSEWKADSKGCRIYRGKSSQHGYALLTVHAPRGDSSSVRIVRLLYFVLFPAHLVASRDACLLLLRRCLGLARSIILCGGELRPVYQQQSLGRI